VPPRKTASLPAALAMLALVGAGVLSAFAPARRISLPPGFTDAGAGRDRRTRLPRQIVGPDGAPMVLVPAGEFLMGSDDGRPDERPARKVSLPSFYIDKFEVTRARFGAYLERAGVPRRDAQTAGDGGLPVSNVTYYQATAYARYAGKCLPTEAQWEKAARGAGARGAGARGRKGRKYPWGKSAPEQGISLPGNFTHGEGRPTGPAPVGSCDPTGSPYGVRDLAGNVWEWCRNWYGWDGRREALFGTARALRGGSWNNGLADVACAARSRLAPYRRGGNVGFRCVLELERTPLSAGAIAKLIEQGRDAVAKGLREEAEDAALAVLDQDAAHPEALAILEQALAMQPCGYTAPEGAAVDQESGLPVVIVSRVDGARLRLVRGGAFTMGTADGYEDERPAHEVYLDAFYIDQTPLTNAQWKKFVDATGWPAPACWRDERFRGDDRPVVGITYSEALSYARWSGRRLPTEAEWERAARGADERVYPWGDEAPDAGGVRRANLKGAADGYAATSPVGAFPQGAGLAGCLDMSGNVWEWTADWYDPEYYAHSPRHSPRGPETGSYRVLRGGAFHVAARLARATMRLYSREDYGYGVTGARLAMTPR